jgi:hypothetical protein
LRATAIAQRDAFGAQIHFGEWMMLSAGQRISGRGRGVAR